MFSVAHIKIKKETGGKHLNKWKDQSIKIILVGCCDKSDSLLFYHPASKQTFTNITFRPDTFLPAGPDFFCLNFDGDFAWNTHADLENSIYRPTSHDTSSCATINLTDQDKQLGTVVSYPINEEDDPYIIQLDDSTIIEAMTSFVSTAPTPDPEKDHLPQFHWVQHGAKITMVPPNQHSPRQGHLRISTTVPGEWEFVQGRILIGTAIPLPNFVENNIHSLLRHKKHFKNGRTFALPLSLDKYEQPRI